MALATVTAFVNMATGGMLAIQDEGDSSITQFLGLVKGTDAIRYWDDSILDWANITGATYDQKYTLEYLTTGDLTGFTMLTVGVVPEPSMLSFLIIGSLMLWGLGVQRRRRLA